MIKLRSLASLLLLTTLPGLASAQSPNVYVVHGIPGTDLGLDPALPVDICLPDGTALLTGVPFGASAPATPTPLDPGFYELFIRLADASACQGAVAVPVSFSVAVGEVSTIVAHLSEQGTPTFTKYVNDLRPIASGQGRVVVRHAASAPPVDVFLTGRGRPAIIRDLRNPEQSVSADLREGGYQARVNPAGAGRKIFGPAPVPVTAGVALFVHAVGSLSTGSFTVIPLALPIP
jgi:hypothetical protein